ncbi:multidrug resistance-associated protein 1-like isoform X2 [Crassostrea virginica]
MDLKAVQCFENYVENWEWNLSAREQPLFLSPCYLENISVWTTQGWIWVISPFYIIYLFQQKTNPNPISRTFITKTLLLLTNMVLLLGHLLNEYRVQNLVADKIILNDTLQIGTLLLAFFFIYLERWKGFVTSGVLFVHWSLSVVISLIPLYSKIHSREFGLNIASFAIFCLVYGIHCLQLILSCFAEKTRYSTDKEISLKSKSSFLERLLFSWVFRLIMKGYRRPLTKDDALSVDSKDKASHLLSSYQSCSRHTDGCVCCIKKNTMDLKEGDGADQMLVARHETEQVRGSKPSCTKHSLIRALKQMFGLEYLMFHLLTMLRVVCKFIKPQLLSLLLEFLEESSEDRSPLWWGYLMAISLFVVSLTDAFTSIHSINNGLNLGRRVSATLMSALFDKVLKIGHISRKTSSVGEILNLMSVDTSTINDTMIFLGIFIENLLEVVLSLYFLYGLLGYAVFAGCGVVLLLVPVNVLLSSRSFKLMQKIMQSKDERIKLLSEVIEGIKILKLYAWEMTFKNKVIDKRKIELQKLLNLKILERILETSFHISPFLVTFVVFLTYILINDQPLDAKTVFVSISLFNILKYSVDLLHISVMKSMKSAVAINRVNTFLNSPDLQQENVTSIDENGIAVKISDGEVTWDDKSVLKKVCIEIKEGKLVAVVGQVGEGKSSLLSAILGEMTKLQGTVCVKGSIAYVPQQAWIQNGSVEDNIVFGNKMNKERYHRVLEACALIPDLQLLPAGDQTEIGERGVNLSGGQKTRISLARAVYSDADVFLLDDPLSAVDSHVGGHIYRNVIGPTGLLKDKTRVLVTHGIQWLPMVDHIYVLSNGEISESGGYDELLSHAGPFAVFLESVLLESKDEEMEDTVKENVLQRLVSLNSIESDDLRTSLSDLNTRGGHFGNSEKQKTARSAEKCANPTGEKRCDVNSDTGKNKAEIKDILIDEENVESGKTFFLPTLRQLKRIAAVSKSPIYSYFSETLAGVPVIRAFSKENQFLRESQRRIDEYHQIIWNEIGVEGWRSLHLELLGCSMILISSVMAVATKDSITAGMAGLSISYSLNVTKLMNWLVYMFGEMETHTVSVERIAEYIEQESEAELIHESHRPSEDWPSDGALVFSSYSTKYRPHLDLVLRNINLSIRPGEKIGIVGRTGAGKSSLTLALFRLIEPVSGSIEIDGEKLNDLGLHDCRSKLTILPQDPVLFAGTLRMNIDPMNQYSDVEIWNALEHAHLKSYVQSLSLGLESECGEGGSKLSLGQKQMVCLARSLLKKTKVLILDEATASVDLETDELIQRTIRQEFQECTVLTIAHRMNTVLDYDRIIVLDNGCVMEFDTPEHLLTDHNSIFYELAKTAGVVK